MNFSNGIKYYQIMNDIAKDFNALISNECNENDYITKFYELGTKMINNLNSKRVRPFIHNKNNNESSHVVAILIVIGKSKDYTIDNRGFGVFHSLCILIC